ncbi:trafficking protein particle complex II-specific subunit 120 [[Candida] jaroonii]|uniref:Trafficking protein particle complex II-specific subunit 120 n=1 Tax=[Candida] jaroonii TaxID=467808 RepID=A0ACA9Y1H5_9ASCO|nr:trafficking protein particle complex II-specific subunit 120 [[Candida] jaroonii]
MDRYNYISPGRVKVLVVPINGCDEQQFQCYYKQVSSCNEVRLLDITPMTELKHFNPQTSPNGRIIYEYDMVVPDNESIFLHDFEPFRKTFIVIGLGKYNDKSLDQYQQMNNDLKKEFPSTIIQNCVFFDTPIEKVEEFNPKTDHSMKSCLFLNESISLESLICDVSRNFLFHLDDYVSSYSNITLRSPVSITDSQLLSKTISKAQKRLSSGSSLKVSFNSNNQLSPAELKGNTQVRHNGRQSKLLASFYLLSGKYVEAMNNFADALLYLKKSEDYMWLGSALEGMGVAIVLMNYTGISYQLPNAILASVLHLSKSKIRDMSIDNTVNKRLSNDNLSTNGRLSYNGNGSKILSPRTSSSSGVSFNLPIGAAPDLNGIAVPELVKQLQDKSNTYFQLSANDFENTVPDLVYIESILRYLHFMIHVFKNGSNINNNFFETLVKNSPPTPDTITNPWYNKNNILNELDKIFSLQLIDLNLIDQCRIYSRLSLIYNDLNMFRKKAFMLRTLIVAILPQLSNQPNESSDSIVTQITNTFDISTIKSIIIDLFNIYQINKQPELKSDDSYENTSSNWNSMQLSLIKLSIKVFENLKDHETLASIFCLSLTRYLHCLPIDDEYKIREKMIGTVRDFGTKIPYPDPYLLRGFKLINNKAQDELIPFSEFQGTEIGEATPLQTPNPANPSFVFDPFNKPTPKSIEKDKLIIKNEIYQLRVLLQNPYSFEIEVNDIDIVSNSKTQVIRSGVRNMFHNVNKSQSKVSLNNPKLRSEKPSSPLVNDFQSNQLIIPPKSIETFIVPFKPLVPGNLIIEGCKIKIGACEERFFPIISEEYNEKLIKLKDYQKFENPKLGDGFEIQDPLQTIVDNLRDNKVLHRVDCTTMELNVLDPQPTLSLLNLSATNGWLMLLEGEKHEFSIDLINQSNQPINYLSFSFWDSTIQNLTKKLSNSSIGVNINAFEMYELEWYLYKYKTFKILNKQEINEKYKPIKANGEIEIKYEITGKKNMTDSKMILEYGNKLNDLTKCFVKNIEIPLKVTVVPSIEMVNLDIMPLFLSSLNGLIKSQSNANLTNLKEFIDNLDQNISDYCLILLDMRNSWKETLQVDIEFDKFQVKESIKANTVSRFLIPMKRVSVKDHDFTKIIPSIRNKQFIKDYSITESEDMEMRQSFWLRNLILDKVQGHWKFHEREGIIDFRNIRLNTKMVNYIIYPKIKILHEIWNEEDEMIKRTGSQFLLKTGEFYSFKTIITNFDSKPLDGVIRHLPFPIIDNNINNSILKEQSMDKKIVINGVLQSKLPQTIHPNESVDINLSFVILENGEFEWGSLLDVLEDDNSYKITAREPVYIVASA